MFREHLPRVVDFDASVSFLSQAAYYEVSDWEEQLLVSFDLSMLLAPFGKYWLEPEPFWKWVNTDEWVLNHAILCDISLIVGLSDLTEVE